MRAISLLLFAIAFSTSLSAQSDGLLDALRRFRDGDLSSAETGFKKVLAAGDNPTARAFLALTEAGTGRCAEAVPELKKQFAENSDADVKRIAGLALVQCQMRDGQYDEGLLTVARLKVLYPSDPEVLYQIARLHMKAWNDTVRNMFSKTPASFRVNELSAEIFEIESQYDAAVSEYRKALAKSPKTIGLHFRLGRALLLRSHEPDALREAQAEFDAELALNPYDAAAEYEAGHILIAQQKPEQAAQHLKRAVELSPDFPEALISLAKIETGRGQNNQAIQLLERAVRLAPRSEAARTGLMLAYRNAGRMEDSQAQKAELEKLLKPPAGEFSEFLKKLGEPKP